METIKTITIRVRADNKQDYDLLEVKKILKGRGICFSDYVKEAVVSHFQEMENTKKESERYQEEIEELKDQMRKIRTWLIKNGMPDDL